MWDAITVRDRFAEAAEVERRLPHERSGPSQKLGYWPEFQASFEERVGWGEKRLAEERELRFRRLPPSSAAISRYEQVLCVWTPEYLYNENERRLVWYWAFCASGGKSFAAVCRKKGWVRRTAYARLDRLFERVAGDLVNDRGMLSSISHLEDCTGFGSIASISGTLANSDLDDIPVSPRSWSDGPASVDQPEIRDFTWAEKQAEREAKRRRKLGLEVV